MNPERVLDLIDTLNARFTLDDLKRAPLEDVVKLHTLLRHWHQVAENEIDRRVKASKREGC